MSVSTWYSNLFQHWDSPAHIYYNALFCLPSNGICLYKNFYSFISSEIKKFTLKYLDK